MRRFLSPTALATLALAACSGGAGHQVQAGPAPTPEPSKGAQIAQTDSLRRPYTEADIRFMTGMIGHHSQAIAMSGWAPTPRRDPSIQTLAARIVNAQQDEIATMQQWLRDRGQPVPEPSPAG